MATKTYDEYKAKQRKDAQADFEQGRSELEVVASKKIQADHAKIDHETDRAVDALQQDKQQATSDAKPIVDAAAVQRLVDEQNVLETMTALGLGASGTKRAALDGAAHRQAVTEQRAAAQVNGAVAKLDRDIAQAQADAVVQKDAAVAKWWNAKDEDVADLWQNLMKRADSTATTLYKADQSDATARYKAQLSAETAKYKADSVAASAAYKADSAAATAVYKADQSAANIKTKLILAVDAQLRKKTGGAYGLSSDGSVVKL